MSDAAPTVSAPTARLVFLDRLRFLAQVDIVSNHAAGQFLLGGIGLPIFLITSVAMTVRKTEPPAATEVAARRTRAILKPWLFWSVAYVPVLLWREWRHDRPPLGIFEPSMLLYGSVIHLWFLPFILLANLAAASIARLTQRFPVRRVICGSALLGVAVLVLSAGLRPGLNLGPPFSQWLFSIACIPLALALGRSISLGANRVRPLAGLALVAVLTWAFGAAGPVAIRLEWALPVRFGLAFTLISITAMYAGQTDRITQMLVRNSFGIYLVHPMLLMIAGEYSLYSESLVVETLLIWSSSLAIVLLIRQTPLARLA